jgi:hypothetical protein
MNDQIYSSSEYQMQQEPRPTPLAPPERGDRESNYPDIIRPIPPPLSEPEKQRPSDDGEEGQADHRME